MDISYLSLLAALLLLIVPAYALQRFDPTLLGQTGKAVARMALQVGAVGAMLWALWRVDSTWLALLWLLLATAVAALVLLYRTHLKRTLLFLPVWGGMLSGVLLTGVYMLFAVVKPAAPLATRWLVPVAAILLLHVLTTNIHGVNTYFQALENDGLTYRTQIGNGKSRLVALTPYVRQALRSMMQPTATNMAVAGLFGLPMLLSGLLLGGLEPVEACVLYIVMSVASVSASVVSLLVTLWLADRTVFDQRGELKPLSTTLDTGQKVDEGQ